MPSNSLLLMKRVNCVVADSNRQQLSGKRMILPSTISKHFELEGLKKGHNVSYIDEIQRRL